MTKHDIIIWWLHSKILYHEVLAAWYRYGTRRVEAKIRRYRRAGR